MKIMYIIEGCIELEKPSSVLNKVLKQSKLWMDNGCSVILFSSYDCSCYVLSDDIKLLFKKNRLCFFVSSLNNLFNLYRSSFYAYKVARDFRIDLVYTRYNLFSPFYSLLFNGVKTIMEINSNDNIEYKNFSIFTRIYNSLFKRFTLQYVDGYIPVSKELGDYINSIVSRKTKVIANGVEKYNILNKLKNGSSRPRLIFVGSPGRNWHGVDKIIQLSESFPQFDFYIVGYEGESIDNRYFLGYLSGDDLEDVYRHADVALSSLNLESAGLHEASPLKSREYFSYGLPVIGGYEDTDLNDAKCFLNLNFNDKDAFKKFEDFVLYWKDKEDAQYLVYDMTRDKLLNTYKEHVRLQFFKSFL